MEERAYGAEWSVEPSDDDEYSELPRRRRPRTPLWRRPVVWGAAAAVVLAGGGVAAGMALGSHGSGPAPTGAADTSGHAHVWGSLTITGLHFIDTQNPNNNFNGDQCKAVNGYDDIATGTAVVVGGPTGQIGVGALSDGTVSNGTCSFSFDVPVPSGLSAYTVTISHRGTQTFTPDQLDGGIRLSLGD